jgi:tetratricopeptide (TPR) repeat protein
MGGEAIAFGRWSEAGVGSMARWRIGLLLALIWAAPAWGLTLADVPPLPMKDDFILASKMTPRLERDGIKAMAPYVADVEAALQRAPAFFPDGVVAEGKRYMLVDGEGEIEIALARAKDLAENDGTTGAAMPLANPYALMGHELGVYYDEIGQFEDGVRVLDQTLALSPDPAAFKGGTMPGMLIEKSFALTELKRYDEALAVCDILLGIPTLTTQDRSRAYRGKGFVFTETDRLDEALDAYRESLKLEPANPRALNEVQYIERLKAGGSKLPSTTLPLDKPRPTTPPQTTPRQTL